MHTEAKHSSINVARGYVIRRALFLALALGASLGLPTSASATQTHLPLETFGSAAQPTFEHLSSIAIDSSGDLLAIDAQAKTLSRFNPDGTPAAFTALGTNVIDAKGAGDGTPQNGFVFKTPTDQQIAVDNSGTLTDGNIYVTQGFKEVGNLIDVFAPSGQYLGQLTAAGSTKFGTAGSGPFSPCGAGVDNKGNLFVGAGYENKVYKFDPSANPPLNTDLVATYTHAQPVCNLAVGTGAGSGSVFVNTAFTFKGDSVFRLSSANLAFESLVDHGEDRLVAVDSSDGHLYAVSSNGIASEFDISGSGSSLVSTFAVGASGGIVVGGTNSRIYIAASPGPQNNAIRVYGPLVTVPDVETGSATLTGDTSATIGGKVDSDGVLLEECSFEYGPTNAYGQVAPCVETPAEIGTAPKEVHADLSSLTAEALYHYTLVARNANAAIKGEDKTFRTPGKPVLRGLWAADVGLTEGTLKARINPENSPTTYRFEWGTDPSYGHSTGEIAIGSGEADHTVTLFLGELAPGTTYHYRVVASNGIEVTEGAGHAFTTYPARLAPRSDCPNQAFRTGPAATLPECRAYEMVSPVDKNGADIKVLVSNFNYPARLDQSSADGNRFTYSSGTAFADAVSAPWTSQYIATREAGQGWSTHAISPPRQPTSLADANLVFKFDGQYRLFSSDLSEAWLLHDSDPPLDGCGAEGFINLYRRDNTTGRYEALVPSEPLSVPKEGYALELQGRSADGTHAVFGSNGKLTSDAANAFSFASYQLYEHIKGEGCGELRLVSVLPNGKASPPGNSVGTAQGQQGESRENSVARAVSEDGSRIFWSGGYPASLYVRIDGNETVRIANEGAQFWTAAADGSKAFYSIENSGSPLDKNLYEYDFEANASTLVAGHSKGVVGASDDASRLYFVSEEVLGGEGVAGGSNLYLREEGGTTRLVATLSGSVGSIGPHAPLGVVGRPPTRGVRVTPDGNHLAFVSSESLTGYDNKDAADGRPAFELYVYDAETGKLACISCNPTGARPEGRKFKGAPESAMVAATVPGWENQFLAPHAFSTDGNRLFFESFEALLPRDTNGKADVYEWQRAASQEACEEAGAELYASSAGGCLSLISTGQSLVDSEFADAAPDGSDVFIRTASSLLPQDPGLVDIYDARVDGGLPQPPGPPAACEGEACQGPLAPPNDPTPASSAFEGAGNVVEKQKSKKKKKHAKKHHKKAKHNQRATR